MEKTYSLQNCQMQFISHQTDTKSYLQGINDALTGGCNWIQLRMKGASDDEVRPIAWKVKEWCRITCAVFIIDDRVELAKEVGADGIHLGKNDMPIAEARKILGPDFIIGGTANTFDDVKAHHEARADYIGCGPFRFTTTKEKLSPVLGLEGYREIVAKMKAHDIRLPIVAIGGITREDIPDIMQTGVTGVAMSGSILRADDPAKETHKIMEMIKEYR